MKEYVVVVPPMVFAGGYIDHIDSIYCDRILFSPGEHSMKIPSLTKKRKGEHGQQGQYESFQHCSCLPGNITETPVIHIRPKGSNDNISGSRMQFTVFFDRR
jgi:hypothetical protein